MKLLIGVGCVLGPRNKIVAENMEIVRMIAKRACSLWGNVSCRKT